jgi:gamma-glutamyltranspeptidase/glutathione hydrolase
MGGDMFMIAWVAKEHRLVALDASGRAPLAATAAHYRKAFGKDMPEEGIQSAVVPGAVDGWATLLDRYGKLGFRKFSIPRFVSPIRVSGQPADRHGMDDEHRHAFERQRHRRDLSQPRQGVGLGRHLPQSRSGQGVPSLATGRTRAFYKGPIAQAIVAKSKASGGLFHG